MNRPLALLWLLATLLPFAYFVYFFSFVMSPPASFAQSKEQFDSLFRLHVIAMGGIWALLASYVVYIFKTKHVASDKKALWAVVIFFGNVIAMPVFWFLYVWRPLSRASGDVAA